MKRIDVLDRYCVKNGTPKNLKYRGDWNQYVLPALDKGKIDASNKIDDILYNR